MTRAAVPCNGCTACCRSGEVIALFVEHGDDPSQYLTKEMIADESGSIGAKRIPAGTKLIVLQQKPNGDCIYLGERGCTIYERAPKICQQFDCRKFFLSMTRNDRRVIERNAKQKSEIFKAGRERLHTLEK